METIFTFIIPHKNIHHLLERCILSIPERTDVEIIVVDDNSKNIDELERIGVLSRDNIQLIKLNESKGAGYARNIGISKAKGKWLVFADSDDYFITNSLNEMMNYYLSSAADIIYFDIACLNAGTLQPASNAEVQYRQYIHNVNAETLCKYKLKVPWGKFLKRDLVVKNNIKFDETLVANDIIFSLKTGLAATTVKIEKTPIYTWLVRNNSLTSIRNRETALLHFNAAVRYNNILKTAGLNQYRINLFLSIPNLYKSSLSIKEIFKLVIGNTTFQYIFTDLFKSIILYIKNKL